MLLGRSNTRGGRGQSPNRSRGASRGRGSTSRGASNSSSKSKSNQNHPHIPTGPRALQEARDGYRTIYRGRNFQHNFKPRYSNLKDLGTSPADSTNRFELERLENAAKREQQRGPNGATVNGRGRGNPRGPFSNKQVRFADPVAADKEENSTSKSPSPAPSNPFATRSTPSPFDSVATSSSNPFAEVKTESLNNPFRTSSASPNPFGAPSPPFQPSPTSSFGRPSGPPTTAPAAAEASSKPSTSLYGTASNPFAAIPQPNGVFSNTPTSKPSSSPPNGNPFGEPSVAQTSALSNASSGSSSFTFGSSGPSSTSTPKPAAESPKTNPFRAPSSSQPSTLSTAPFGKPSNTFGSPSTSGQTSNPTTFGAKPTVDGLSSKSQSAARPTKTAPSPNSMATPASASSSVLANRMDQLLRKQGIVPPAWPTQTPGDPNQKGAVEAFWQTSKGYRSKVRASLIRGGFLDDPDKPKRLSEAIDFKGTCEDMCPEFEKITRIVEHDVQSAEKELAPDGSLWPAPHRMVKALARSAAGQDAPLPMDVRSPAALRRTLDYLLHTILGEDGDLKTVHGFLWDRTRAIRRDFVFQSSMSPAEQADQIYCLERITRFHVIALHQMSRAEVVAEDFSEQQEVEQLGKALLSLIHAYEDCQAQGISCENEAEFRAYYVLFNSHNSGILETVQDWGWKFWGESDQIRTAVSLVETLQNIWDTRGPLKPHSATDIAQNCYSRFFSIVADKKVSYTMACFAEIHFNSVRKSVLKTIIASYRKQRDQTKDWTLTKLNSYLRFDDEEDIIEFGEAYELQFGECDGEIYLSFESEDVQDPFPPLKQRYSYALVERKRGEHSLPAVIDATVYDEGDVTEEPSDEDSLFVKESSGKAKTAPGLPSSSITVREYADDSAAQSLASTPTLQTRPEPDNQKPTSIFSHGAAPQPSGANFFAPKPVDSPPVVQPDAPKETSSLSSKPPAQEAASSTITQKPQPPIEKPTSPFSFLNQPLTEPANASTKSPLFLEKQTVAASPPQTERPKSFFFDQQPVNATPPVQSPKPLFSFGQPSVTASPSTQNPMPEVSLGGHPVTSPKQPSFESAAESPRVATSSTPAAQSSLSQQAFGTGPTMTPSPNPAPSGSPQQQAQQSNSFSIQPTQEKSGEGINFSATAKAPPSVKRESQLGNFAKWVAIGDGGILDQFTEFKVEEILRNAVCIYLKENGDRIAKEEADQAQEQADQFRYRSLATKYGQKWREAAHRMWLRRRGREARKARREMAESFRASKAVQSANLVDDFRASANSSRRGSLESLLDATGVLTGVHDSNSEIRTIVQTEETQPSPKRRRRSDRSTDSPISNTNGHKRSKSENPLRRSILSDPTYLRGGSRIHLMSKYEVRDETRRQVSGVQTDYFRLKARGISTLPDGTPLASSVAKDILHQKRSFDGVTKPASPKSLMPPPAARSVPTEPSTRLPGLRDSAERNDAIQAMKDRANAMVAGEQKPWQRKRSMDLDDEELFARAKRVREQMDEGMEFYRKERESRSVS